MQRDVNVPHGKAATETLMLTTVVSLASDDPGPELGTRRGEEERRERELRCYGPGVTRGGERGVTAGAAPGPVNVSVKIRSSGLRREMLQLVTTSSRAFKISRDVTIFVNSLFFFCLGLSTSCGALLPQYNFMQSIENVNLYL